MGWMETRVENWETITRARCGLVKSDIFYEHAKTGTHKFIRYLYVTFMTIESWLYLSAITMPLLVIYSAKKNEDRVQSHECEQ